MQKLATLYSDLSLNYMANNDYKQVLFQGRCAELFMHLSHDYKKNFNMQYVLTHEDWPNYLQTWFWQVYSTQLHQ